ncbi:MAG: ABC transporter substrate-binding protein [Labilithrix sp.]|nr:ABC transporter substrate-binding protein [Labilithrix sp.]
MGARQTRTRLRRPLALGFCAAGAAFAISALGVEQGCSEQPPPPVGDKPILIGVSFGLSAGLKDFAAPLRDSIRVAEGQINAAGGVLGRRVFFDVQDDESDEEAKVEEVANDFVRKGAVAVIGPLSSGQVVRVQQIYAEKNIIQISPSATSTDITNIQPSGDRWLFRTTPADDFQGAAVLLFSQRTPRGLGDAGAPPEVDGGPPSTCRKMAIVHVDNAYGKSMADVIEKAFPRRAGQPILARKSVSVKVAASYVDVVAQIMPLEPECVALITYDDVGAQFVRDFKTDPGYAALAAKGFFFIGTDGVYTDGFIKKGLENESDPKSPNIAEGVYGTNPDTQPGTKEYNEFRTIFSSYFPLGVKDAPSFGANTFDAAVLIALAIQRAGNTNDRDAIRRSLIEVANAPGKPFTPAQLGDALQAAARGEDIDYKGASGTVDLEPNGNVKSGFIVWEAFRNTKREVEYRTVGRFALEELVDQLK